jgi:hypothetical protein
MDNLYVEKIHNSIAKELIVKHHYTHKWTIAELCIGIYDKSKGSVFFDVPTLVGAVVFGPTAGANVARSVSPLLNHSNLWELKRLWVADELGKNTESWVIGQCLKYIKQHHSEIKCLISYADPDAGHIGTIYQATNWLYQDIERPKGTSGYIVSFDGGTKWQHSRTLFNKYGTFNYNKLVEVLPRPFKIKELSVKERYIYPLGSKVEKKNLIKSLNYPIIEYPKLKSDKETVMEFN